MGKQHHCLELDGETTLRFSTKVVADMEGNVVHSPTNKELHAENENLGSDLLTQIQQSQEEGLT